MGKKYQNEKILTDNYSVLKKVPILRFEKKYHEEKISGFCYSVLKKGNFILLYDLLITDKT